MDRNFKALYTYCSKHIASDGDTGGKDEEESNWLQSRAVTTAVCHMEFGRLYQTEIPVGNIRFYVLSISYIIQHCPSQITRQYETTACMQHRLANALHELSLLHGFLQEQQSVLLSRDRRIWSLIPDRAFLFVRVLRLLYDNWRNFGYEFYLHMKVILEASILAFHDMMETLPDPDSCRRSRLAQGNIANTRGQLLRVFANSVYPLLHTVYVCQKVEPVYRELTGKRDQLLRLFLDTTGLFLDNVTPALLSKNVRYGWERRKCRLDDLVLTPIVRLEEMDRKRQLLPDVGELFDEYISTTTCYVENAILGFVSNPNLEHYIRATSSIALKNASAETLTVLDPHIEHVIHVYFQDLLMFYNTHLLLGDVYLQGIAHDTIYYSPTKLTAQRPVFVNLAGHIRCVSQNQVFGLPGVVNAICWWLTLCRQHKLAYNIEFLYDSG